MVMEEEEEEEYHDHYLVPEEGTPLLLCPGVTRLGRGTFPIPLPFHVNCSREQAFVKLEREGEGGRGRGRLLVRMSITCEGVNPLLFRRSRTREKAGNTEANFYLDRGKTVDLFVGDKFFLAPWCFLTVVKKPALYFGDSPSKNRGAHSSFNTERSFNTELSLNGVSQTPRVNSTICPTFGVKLCLKSVPFNGVQTEKPEQTSEFQNHNKRHIECSKSSPSPAPILRHHLMKKTREKEELRVHLREESTCTEVKTVCISNRAEAVPSSSNRFTAVVPYQILDCFAQQRKGNVPSLGLKRIRSLEEISVVESNVGPEVVARRERKVGKIGGLMETSEGEKTARATNVVVNEIGGIRKFGTGKEIQTEGVPSISLPSLGLKRIQSVEENSTRKVRVEEKLVARKLSEERKTGGMMGTSEREKTGRLTNVSVNEIGGIRKFGTGKEIQTEGVPSIQLTKKTLKDPITVMDQVTRKRSLSNLFFSEETMQGVNACMNSLEKDKQKEMRKTPPESVYGKASIKVYSEKDKRKEMMEISPELFFRNKSANNSSELSNRDNWKEMREIPPELFFRKASAKISLELPSEDKREEIGRTETTVGSEIPLSGYVCAICQEEKLSETMGLLSCNHSFCFTCILEWSKKTVATTPTCPLCKTPFDFITSRTQGEGERESKSVVLVGRGARRAEEKIWRQSRNMTGRQSSREVGPFGGVQDSSWFGRFDDQSRNRRENQWLGQSSGARGDFLPSENNELWETVTPLPDMRVEAPRTSITEEIASLLRRFPLLPVVERPEGMFAKLDRLKAEKQAEELARGGPSEVKKKEEKKKEVKKKQERTFGRGDLRSWLT